MTLTSDFSLHTEILKRDCPNVFDCKSYDTILHAANILFGDRNVTHNESSIFIKDRVCIELSLSWNEQKAYIYTYFDFDMMKGERRNDANDINYELRVVNPYFRLFGLDEILKYLQLKQMENKFIRAHEG
jgi:hypothetical protein